MVAIIVAIIQSILPALLDILRRKAPDPVVSDAPPAPRGLREHVRDRLRRHRERAGGSDSANDLRG